MCFKIPSPRENYGLQHWCREWIQLNDLKCLQVSFSCQPNLPKSPCLGLSPSPGKDFARLGLLTPLLVTAAPFSLQRKALLAETGRPTFLEKFQEEKLEFGLFKGWALLTTEAAWALDSRAEFYTPKSWPGDVRVHDMRPGCIFCPESPAQNTGICSPSNTGEKS